MKRIFTRTTAIAALVTSAAAYATPVYFDFTGTLDANGHTISGGFNFETDRMIAGTAYEPGQYAFVDPYSAGAAAPPAFLSFDDRSLSFPLFARNSTSVTFNEGCAAVSCPQFVSDWFSLQAETSEADFAGYTGTVHSNTLQIYNFSETAPDYLGLDTFQGEHASALDVANLPLLNMFGLYLEAEYDCVNGDCSIISDEVYSFAVDSVARGVGARAVPEPGTLGLLSVALGGILLMRRRRLRLS
jgi:hypothetical protein